MTKQRGPIRVQIIPMKGHTSRPNIPRYADLMFETNHSISVRTDDGDKLILRKTNYRVKRIKL